MLAERCINQRLIVSTTGIVDLLLKPSQQVVINPNGNPSLALGRSHDRPALSFGKIVLFAH